MKTLFKALASACFALAMVSTSQGADDKAALKDQIMMKAGKMMVMKEGKMTAMDKEMMLENGTKVMVDGTVMRKGGEKVTLAEGDSIDMMGEKMKMKGHEKKDHIMMKDGKMMVMKDGKMMAMEKDMTLENGTMVKTDGTVMMKDGDKMMLKDGEGVDMMGKKMAMKMKKDKK